MLKHFSYRCRKCLQSVVFCLCCRKIFSLIHVKRLHCALVQVSVSQEEPLTDEQRLGLRLDRFSPPVHGGERRRVIDMAQQWVLQPHSLWHYTTVVCSSVRVNVSSSGSILIFSRIPVQIFRSSQKLKHVGMFILLVRVRASAFNYKLFLESQNLHLYYLISIYHQDLEYGTWCEGARSPLVSHFLSLGAHVFWLSLSLSLCCLRRKIPINDYCILAVALQYVRRKDLPVSTWTHILSIFIM